MKTKIQNLINIFKKIFIFFLIILSFSLFSHKTKTVKKLSIQKIIENNTEIFINRIKLAKFKIKQWNKKSGENKKFNEIFEWKKILTKLLQDFYTKNKTKLKNFSYFEGKIILKSEILNYIFDNKEKIFEYNDLNFGAVKKISEYENFNIHFSKHLESVFLYNERLKVIKNKRNWNWNKNFYFVYTKKNKEALSLKEIVFIKKNTDFYNAKSFLVLTKKIINIYDAQQKGEYPIKSQLKLLKVNSYFIKKINKVKLFVKWFFISIGLFFFIFFSLYWYFFW